jgi:hypothetical protein
VTPDDYDQISAYRATFPTHGPHKDASAAPAEPEVPSAYDQFFSDDVADAADYDPGEGDDDQEDDQ